MSSGMKSSSSSGELDLLTGGGSTRSRSSSAGRSDDRQSSQEVTSKEIVIVASRSAEVVLHDTTTLITHSGDPDVSTPSDIPIDNPRSSLVQSDVVRVMYRYNFPGYVKVRVPMSYERIDWKVPDYFSMYELPFRTRLRFPFPRLCHSILRHWGVAPSQLMPNSWRILLGLEALCWICEVDFGIHEFLYTYFFKEHEREK